RREIDLYHLTYDGKMFIGEIKKGEIGSNDIRDLVGNIKLLIYLNDVTGRKIQLEKILVVTVRSLNNKQVQRIIRDVKRNLGGISEDKIEIIHGKLLLETISKSLGIPRQLLEDLVGS
ncbi:MAG: hypothetical protein ACTSX9_02770, partial [Candidatus Njordarchaeales archaeon]